MTIYSSNAEAQLFERFRSFTDQEENRGQIEIEITDLAKESLDVICKVIRSSPDVRKVTLTSIQRCAYMVDLIVI